MSHDHEPSGLSSISSSSLTADDERLLRRTFALARFAKNRASGPYGALCARNGQVADEGENTEGADKGDLTCHAELNLIRKLSKEFPKTALAEMTLYASTEPCPMCAGAIALAGIRRVVFGASASRAAERTQSPVAVDCRLIFSQLSQEIEVLGPHLEEEALQALL